MKVLFVCGANVGRSQIAEAIFNHLAEGLHTAVSAGVKAIGSDGKDLDGMLLKDRASAEYVIKCLAEIGIDVSNKMIKQLTPRMVAEADRVVLMVPREETPEFLLGSDRITYWEIQDPDGEALEYFRNTRDQIQKLVLELLNSSSLI